MFHTRGASVCPLYVWMPIMQTPPNAPYGQTPPYVPNAPLYICMFWGYLHVIWGCGGHPYIWTPLMCLDASPCVQHPPTHLYASLLVCIF